MHPRFRLSQIAARTLLLSFALVTTASAAGDPRVARPEVARVLETLNGGEAAEALVAFKDDGSLRHIGAPAGQQFEVVAASPELAARQFLSEHAAALGLESDATTFV